MSEDYRNKPLARTLISFIPYVGGAIDTGLSTRLNQIDEERRRLVLDELSRQRMIITQAMLDDHDWLRSWCLLYEAMSRTIRGEKAIYLAKLWASFSRDGRFAEQIDSFEEFRGVLEDLRPREMAALLLLRDIENRNPFGEVENDNELRRAWRGWDEFQSRLEAEIGVPQPQQAGFLARLQRTGLYRTIVGGYLDYEGDVGSLTPYFEALLDALVMIGDDTAD